MQILQKNFRQNIFVNCAGITRLFQFTAILNAQVVAIKQNVAKEWHSMSSYYGESSPKPDLFRIWRDERGFSPLIRRSRNCCEGMALDE